MTVGYAAAFAGGILALLSPCSALLLPSFFAYAFSRPSQLIARTAVFGLGLMAILVPLGVGSSFASVLFYGHRTLLVTVAGWLIIGFGVLQIVGAGFSVRPAQSLQSKLAGRRDVVAVFGLGAAYGLAGFCSGPILGAVLTVAAATGRPVQGAALLAVYAAGMVVPLFLLALAWNRFCLGERRLLRGRCFSVGPLQLHSTSVLSGLLFVVVGILFLLFDGTAALNGAFGIGVSVDTEASLQQRALNAANHVPDLVAVLVAAVIALVVVILAATRRRQPSSPAVHPSQPEPLRPER